MAVIASVDQFDTQMPFPLEIREKTATMASLYAIPTNARWSGMRVWVEAEQAVYILACFQSEVGDNSKWLPLYGVSGLGARTSLVTTTGTDVSIAWTADLAPDGSGVLTSQTYIQRFGSAPQIQVYRETAANTFALYDSPITLNFTGGALTTVTIGVGGQPARIVIK